MGRKAITPETYELLIKAFRDPAAQTGPHGVNMAAAARLAGVHVRTAERAYLEGWPRKGMPSVQSVFVDEQLEARARLAREAQERVEAAAREREAARRHAVEARAAEGKMVELARTSASQALAVSNTLLAGARKLAVTLKGKLEAEAAAQEPGMTSTQQLHLLSRVVTLADAVNRQARTAMLMERLHLGEPTEIVEHLDDRTDLSAEEVQLRIEAAQQALASVRGGQARLQVIEGGGGAAPLADSQVGLGGKS